MKSPEQLLSDKLIDAREEIGYYKGVLAYYGIQVPPLNNRKQNIAEKKSKIIKHDFKTKVS